MAKLVNAESYDVNSENQRKDALELLAYLTARMSWASSEVVLDFGCGAGFVTKNILLPLVLAAGGAGDGSENGKTERRLYAFDNSEQQIAFARSNYASPLITYQVEDIMLDGFQTELRFDKIFSSAVLHWIPDQVKALERMYELLRPKGEVGLFYVAYASTYNLYSVMAQNPKWSSYLADYETFIPVTQQEPEKGVRRLQEALEKMGFTVQECRTLPKKHTFQSVDASFDAVWSVHRFVGRIPGEQLEDYKSDYRAAFTTSDVFRTTEHGVEFDYSFVLIRARKET